MTKPPWRELLGQDPSHLEPQLPHLPNEMPTAHPRPSVSLLGPIRLEFRIFSGFGNAVQRTYHRIQPIPEQSEATQDGPADYK